MNKATQAALWAMDDFFKKNPDPQQPLHRARLRGIIRAYGERWEADKDLYSVLAVEELMMAPILSDTGKDSGFMAGGKIDVVIKENVGGKNLVILDHKFLSSAFTPEKAEHLTIDGQPSQYAFLCWSEGIKVTHVMWDVIVKSLHRKGKNETYSELEDRIFSIYSEDRERFGRYKVPVIKDNVAEFLSELHDWAREIGLEAKGSRHLKSRGHCFEFSHPCRFLGVCTGYSDVTDTEKWKVVGPKHNELELPKGVNPFNIITNSRVKSYQTCRQKHHYEYNMGLVKLNEVQEEPLFVGSAGHVGLEAYWQTIAKGEN